MQACSILLVCLGNICRSPLAEGAVRARAATAGLADRLRIDSAGLGPWHAGSPPDARAVRVAAAAGIDISGQRARQLVPGDFTDFDLVLAMDRSNLAELAARRPATATATLDLFVRHGLGTDTEVPDPYYGGDDGFAAVLELVIRAGTALVDRLAGEDAAGQRTGRGASISSTSARLSPSRIRRR